LLVEVITAACPVFSHPLYIGVADSLRIRLKDHADEYFNLRAAQSESPQEFTDYRSEQTFAQRAFRLGLKEENLMVYFRPIEVDEKLGQEATRETLEAAEWILNRWATPLLGRRYCLFSQHRRSFSRTKPWERGVRFKRRLGA
jgi:hypothetical protein